MQLFAAICRAKSAREVLNALLPCARMRGICRLRYYHYSAKEGKLVSVESAGHGGHLASRFRKGLITKLLASKSLDRWDSFWCFSLRKPVFVSVERHSRFPLKPQSVYGAKVLRVPKEQCGTFLEGHKARLWVDLPLRVANNYVGKLSCDIEGSAINERVSRQVFRFWKAAQLAAPYLEAFFSAEVSTRIASVMPNVRKGLPRAMFLKPMRREVREAISRIQGCRTSAELLDFCVDVLPRKLFGCKYASFFSLLRDSHGYEKLVLRRSSYPKCAELENLGYYLLSEDALTTWVANHRRALRLHELTMRGTSATCERPANGPVWLNKIQDSDTHNSFLADAVLLDSGELQGVFRLTQKLSRAGRFTEKDQRLLEELVKEYIGPRLQHLRNSEIAGQVTGRLHEVMSIAVVDSVRKGDLSAAFGEFLGRIFKDTPASRKAFVINLLNDDRSAFKHVHLGGSLPFKSSKGKEFSLNGTFTGLVMKSGRLGTTFLHDFKGSGIAQAIRARSPDARCGMVCPIAFEEEKFGVMAVLSDHYDVQPESHGLLLELASIQAGGMYACRRRGALRFSDAGLRHDLIDLLRKDESLISREVSRRRLANKNGNGELEAASGLTSFSLRLIDAYVGGYPVQAKILEANRVPFDCETEIDLVIKAAEKVSCARGRVEREFYGKQKVLVCPAPVVAIVYNLLKNALAAGGPNGPVRVATRIDDSKLEIKISNGGSTLPIDELAEAVSLDPIRLVERGVCDDSTEYRKGLYICGRLAVCYKLPDGRHGAIAIVEGRSPFACEAILTIPV